MSRVAIGFAVAWSLCFASACEKKDAPPDPTATAAPSLASASAAPAPAAASTTAVAAAPPSESAGSPPSGETLMGRLAQEARQRPGIKPTAEDCFAAFDALGSGVPQKEQTLGSTYKAAYCVGGFSNDRSMAINVCEYPTEAAATAGRDQSRGLFPKMPARDVWRRKATTLTIVRENLDAATAAKQKKVVDAFLAL